MYNETSVSALPSTSPVTVKRLKSIGIHTYEDLISYFPYRYEDYSLTSSIAKLQTGELVTVKGSVSNVTQIYTRRGLRMQKARLTDDTGHIDITWYNQPYLLTLLRSAQFLSVSGKVTQFGRYLSIQPEQYEVLKAINDPTFHTGKIVAVYSEKHGLTSRLLRTKIAGVLESYRATEYLPNDFHIGMFDEERAYRAIHVPSSLEEAAKARERLSFDELFFIQMASAKVRAEWKKLTTGAPLNIKDHEEKLDKLVKSLPFELTGAQKRTLQEILADLGSSVPMNRFLQGDVGSGKTIVAALACYIAFLNGYQSVFMAPTGILANQHFESIKKVFEHTKVKVALQTGSIKNLKQGKNFDIIVGTHALLNDKLDFKKVALVVIDEQHRFGVAQRAKLKEKGNNPHLLTMTATPIPRTVVLTLHGELELSVLNEMPKGRKTIKTHLVPQVKKMDGYKWIADHIKREKVQVFVVCPLIEESEIETMKSVKAATQEYEYLKKTIFPEFNVALLHGKMKSVEKDKLMQDFKEKKYDILVTTSVVEVGIDIANATIMIIEGADRFGIAQLHQLRGRVGRSEKQSYCFLYTEKTDPSVINRLNYFATHQDGMDLAEYDLKIRGPGDMYGTSQHGYMDLKIASFADRDMIYRAKKAVDEIVKETNFDFAKYPELKKRLEAYDRQMISHD